MVTIPQLYLVGCREYPGVASERAVRHRYSVGGPVVRLRRDNLLDCVFSNPGRVPLGLNDCNPAGTFDNKVCAEVAGDSRRPNLVAELPEQHSQPLFKLDAAHGVDHIDSRPSEMFTASGARSTEQRKNRETTAGPCGIDGIGMDSERESGSAGHCRQDRQGEERRRRPPADRTIETREESPHAT